MADYILSAKITGDSSGFEKAISNAQKAADSFENKMKSVSVQLSDIGGSLSGLGEKLSSSMTTPLASAGKSMISAASDFDTNLKKVNIAFGESSNIVTTWTETATKQFGLSKNQALEATSVFGNMAVSMGLTQPEAANMSASLAGLAGDLASFSGIGVEQSMDALSGVFTGETEGLEHLGVVMTETNLEDFAAKTGKVYSEMSEAEKAQLRYNYVMQMTSEAQGDYARMSDGTANSMKGFQGAVDNLYAVLGQQLLPILTPLIQKVTEITNAFADASPQFQQMAIKMGGIATVSGPVLTVLGDFAGTIGKVTNTIGLLSGKINSLGGMKGIFSKIFEKTSGKIELISGKIAVLGGKINSLGGMKGILSSVFTGLTSPVGIAVMAITALIAVFSYLMSSNEEFRNSVMLFVAEIQSAFYPVMQQLGALLVQIGSLLMSTIMTVLQALVPLLSTIVTVVAQLFAALVPLILQIVSVLTPVIMQVISFITSLISAVLPPLIVIINVILSAIQGLIQPILSILSVVIVVISSIISAITPIVSFIAGIIANIINVISGIISTVSSVFGSVFNIVTSIMSNVGGYISGIFDNIQSAWTGLTGFVSGIFNGIASAVDSLVGQVKGFVNGVIGGINAAIGLINQIPGVSISQIPQLLHGTDNWKGGFARMNEGGRGELTYLPNGSQVIPHDVSVKYAKEAARSNAAAEPIDMYTLGNYIASTVLEQGKQNAAALERGISKMKMVSDKRETARFISELGFVRG